MIKKEWGRYRCGLDVPDRYPSPYTIDSSISICDRNKVRNVRVNDDELLLWRLDLDEVLSVALACDFGLCLSLSFVTGISWQYDMASRGLKGGVRELPPNDPPPPTFPLLLLLLSLLLRLPPSDPVFIPSLFDRNSPSHR